MTKKIDINYIQNLTDDLIGSSRLYLYRIQLDQTQRYLIDVRDTLLRSAHFQDMNPDTLGKVIGNIGRDYVERAPEMPPAPSPMGYSDGMTILRNQASTLLAFIILDRLNPRRRDETYSLSKFAGQTLA